MYAVIAFFMPKFRNVFLFDKAIFMKNGNLFSGIHI